jgi:alpha-tubulin suppressor-like RCC1 family protein
MFGNNSSGNLGVGDEQPRLSPIVPNSFLEAANYGMKVRAVAVGNKHSVCLMDIEGDEDSSLIFAWGGNEFSQLGSIDAQIQKASHVAIPHQIFTNLEVTVHSIYCQSDYSCLLTMERQVAPL